MTTNLHVLTARERGQVNEHLLAAAKCLTLTIELIEKSYRAPSTWILGRPTPRELDCGQAEVPLHLARFDLGCAADLLRRSAL